MRSVGRAFQALILLVILGLHGLSAESPKEYRASVEEIAEILEMTRSLLPRPEVAKFLRETFKDYLTISPEDRERYGFPDDSIREFSETQFIVLLLKIPKVRVLIREFIAALGLEGSLESMPSDFAAEWRQKFLTFIDDHSVFEKFKKYNDPLEPMTLKMPGDVPGFEVLEFLVNHPHYRDGTLLPADDLSKSVIKFVDETEKELFVSVFDFDLMSVAEALKRAHKRGVKINVLIDDKVIEARPEVQRIIAFFDSEGIPYAQHLKPDGTIAPGVNAVGLHHHKLLARDWSVPDKAQVILLSGNLTQSCIGKEGDLVDLPPSSRTKFSIPNANHLLLVKSPLLALIIHHELTKLSDLRLRGKNLPWSGAIRLLGPVRSSEEGPTSLVIAFTPNGALNNVNVNFISRIIGMNKGPIAMAQFAFSSKPVEEALMRWALQEIQENRVLDFKSVGDTPFAMMDWSVFLRMAGYRVAEKDGLKFYEKIPDEENKWKQILGAELFTKFQRDMLRVAPSVYGNRKIKVGDIDREVTAKIHHKIIVFLKAVIMGSFNFSQGAENNDEYIVALFDPLIAEAYRGMIQWLFEQSPRSVAAEAIRRNHFHLPPSGEDPNAPPARLIQAMPGSSLDDCNRKLLEFGTIAQTTP